MDLTRQMSSSPDGNSFWLAGGATNPIELRLIWNLLRETNSCHLDDQRSVFLLYLKHPGDRARSQDDAQDITIVELANDSMHVEASQLLALTGQIKTEVKFSGLRGASSGQGLFTTIVSGTGSVALLSAGGPLIALAVDPQYPLVVDPDAFVAHRGSLNQSFVTDVTWRSAIGGGSGEAFSLRFDGQGVVYIQPEER